jgi:hypothetical protein
VKVEEDEVDGDEELEGLQCEGPNYSLWGRWSKICQECNQKKGKTSILTMCFNLCSFQILNAKN